MFIAVDAMGGDFAPRAVVEGAALAAAEGIGVILVGDRRAIARELERLGLDPEGTPHLLIEHAEQVVAMEERAIVVAKKRQASMRVCARLVKENRAQAMVTAGNTGAALIVAKTVIGTLPGVDRPALAGVFPNRSGRTVVLDVGANVGAKASHLCQFAVMGHFYAQEILGTAKPRVGLLSIGEEEVKGTELTKLVYKVLQRTDLNFVGNVEGRDIFRGTVDVIVCDGFVGNAMLKSSESLASYLGSLMKRELRSSLRTAIGYWLAKPALEEFRRLTDWAEYGAAPLLGVKAGVFIGHGRSNAKAISNAIRRAAEFSAAGLGGRIRDKLAELDLEKLRLAILGAEN